jgi:hypothetical protein
MSFRNNARVAFVTQNSSYNSFKLKYDFKFKTTANSSKSEDVGSFFR